MTQPFYRIEMLPALHGDALLVEYGNARTRRILIDGGPLGAFPAVKARLDALPAGDQRVELLVITHVDTDHVEGIIRLLAMPEAKWPIDPREIWFNGWRHLEESRNLGGREGELMSALIHRRAGDRWNTSFGGSAVRVQSVAGDRIDLEGGMTLTMVSPDAKALENLLKDWRDSAEDWEIDPGDLDAAWAQLVDESKFHPNSELTLGPEDLTDRLRKLLKGKDGSKANGSSIAFLGSFGGKSCLFLGDAHMKVVCASLQRLGATEQTPLRIDAVKLSHHGSKHNITPEFLELVDAQHYLISSNGDRFRHPDRDAIEAVIRGSQRKPTLWFNYRSDFTASWEAASQKLDARYETRYPAVGKEGIVVTL
ncbi:MAG: hypothetical protein ABL982_03185 [Vicinamibacterales bacterium]